MPTGHQPFGGSMYLPPYSEQPPYPGQPGRWQPQPDPLISPDYSGWWQRAMAVVQSSWRQLVALHLILAVITFGVQGTASVAGTLMDRDLARATDGGEPPPIGDLLAVAGVALGAVLVVVVLSILATLAAVHIVVVAATGGRPRLTSCLAGAAGRLFPMIGWTLLAGLVVLVGFCACVLPAIYVVAVFTILAPVVALERTGAIARCFKLFHGDLGASVARVATILGIWLGGVLLAAVTAAVGGAVTDPESASTAALVLSALVGSAVDVAVFGVLSVLTDPLIVAAYADMRARVEPLTSAVLAQELAR